MANYGNQFGGFSPYPMDSTYRGYESPYNYARNNTQMNQYAFVNGIEGAKSFQLQPNQSIMLMDSDSPICYMKQTNSVGQATLRYFKLIETSEDELRGNKQAQPKEDYALKSDFDALSKRIDDLARKIGKPNKNENKEN